MWSRSTILIALVIALSGCQTWRPVTEVSPRAYMETESGQARVFFRQGGAPLEMRDWTWVEGDSIRGLAHSQTGGRTTRTIALDDIGAVEERRVDPMKSFGAAALTFGLVSTIVSVIAIAQYDGDWLNFSISN